MLTSEMQFDREIYMVLTNIVYGRGKPGLPRKGKVKASESKSYNLHCCIVNIDVQTFQKKFKKLKKTFKTWRE